MPNSSDRNAACGAYIGACESRNTRQHREHHHRRPAGSDQPEEWKRKHRRHAWRRTGRRGACRCGPTGRRRSGIATASQAAASRIALSTTFAIDRGVLRGVGEREHAVDVEGAVFGDARAHRQQHLLRIAPQHLENRQPRLRAGLPSIWRTPAFPECCSRMNSPTPTSTMLSRNGTRQPQRKKLILRQQATTSENTAVGQQQPGRHADLRPAAVEARGGPRAHAPRPSARRRPIRRPRRSPGRIRSATSATAAQSPIWS